MPTAKGKISRRIETSNGMFYERELWTLRFPLNQNKHKQNKQAVEKLIDDLIEESKYNFEKINGCNVIKNVDSTHILNFIDNFYFYEKESFGGLNKFIESENNFCEAYIIISLKLEKLCWRSFIIFVFKYVLSLLNASNFFFVKKVKKIKKAMPPSKNTIAMIVSI